MPALPLQPQLPEISRCTPEQGNNRNADGPQLFFHRIHETGSISGDVRRHGNGVPGNHRDRDAAKLMQRYTQSRYGKFRTGELAADVPLL